ncbi:hypothetical protein [Verrucomicrobium sp. BvORR034]|uniref:hypothetical protein n=1 Tax=Verrucomicrobium sp. BvORR034 TaxID=1396418 RepID=UPI0006790A76|nr:hypothetical protein [Verrucomicrobium sp. BvORR034]
MKTPQRPFSIGSGRGDGSFPEDFRVQINFNNLTDKRHFVGSYDKLYVMLGAPCDVNSWVNWKF